MFSTQERKGVLERVIGLASSDARVVAGAIVGSAAREPLDRWADLDLAFGVGKPSDMRPVLDEFATWRSQEFDAVALFDLPAGSSIFRVLLLQGCLQCDLSVMPSTDFGAIGPKFTLLFGQAVEKGFVRPLPARDIFGYAVHHAVRARFCIERGRFWQAEYWISGLRDYTLALACASRNLPTRDGRGFDDLPAAVTNGFQETLVTSLDRTHLLGVLRVGIDRLLQHGGDVQDIVTELAPRLRDLVAEWDSE